MLLEPMDLGYLRRIGLAVHTDSAKAKEAPASAPSAAAKVTSSAPSAALKGSGGGAPASAGGTSGGQAPKPLNALTKAPVSGGLTEHVFLTDTSLVELDGCKLIEVVKVEKPPEAPKDAPEGAVQITVLLNRTIFHSQGGGQPADVGTLTAEGLPELAVSFASCRKEDGAILHDCWVLPATADAWSGAASSVQVSCHVDAVKRKLAARLHSAGHLLDCAVNAIQPPLKWIPGKGFHFPDGPYVEYVLNDASRKIDMKKAAEKDAIIKEIQDNMDRFVATGGRVNIQYKDGVRHVEMAGEECGCGGTHVADVSEIGKIEVRKMANKQGNIRLSYQVA